MVFFCHTWIKICICIRFRKTKHLNIIASIFFFFWISKKFHFFHHIFLFVDNFSLTSFSSVYFANNFTSSYIQISILSNSHSFSIQFKSLLHLNEDDDTAAMNAWREDLTRTSTNTRNGQKLRIHSILLFAHKWLTVELVDAILFWFGIQKSGKITQFYKLEFFYYSATFGVNVKYWNRIGKINQCFDSMPLSLDE